MVADKDKQSGNGTGFSGLSTLVSDVEDNRGVADLPAGVLPLREPPESPQSQAETAPVASATPQSTKGMSGSPSDVTSGKWMIGIGLGIGLLLIIFVNATRNESTRSTAAPVARAPTTPVRAYPQAGAPVVPRHQSAQETFIQQSAATESVDVLGQKVVFSNPSGYCTPGNSAREVELMELSRRALGEGTRLVHAAVSCSELEDYRMGRRDLLDHWLQIQLVGSKGNFQRLEMSREEFLSSLSKSIPRVDAAELNQRLNASLANSDITMSDAKFEPVGRDGNVVYFSMVASIGVGEASRPVTGIGGITLLNSLPLLVNVYEGTGSAQSRGQLPSVQRELLNSLLTEN